MAMRIPKEQAKKPGQAVQCVLFEDEGYQYGIFCANQAGPAHKVISEHDKRADAEKPVGEAKR